MTPHRETRSRELQKFHATVVMPAPIVRANTCFEGDTARWEFVQHDLFGRGFEMRVEASTKAH